MKKTIFKNEMAAAAKFSQVAAAIDAVNLIGSEYKKFFDAKLSKPELNIILNQPEDFQEKYFELVGSDVSRMKFKTYSIAAAMKQTMQTDITGFMENVEPRLCN